MSTDEDFSNFYLNKLYSHYISATLFTIVLAYFNIFQGNSWAFYISLILGTIFLSVTFVSYDVHLINYISLYSFTVMQSIFLNCITSNYTFYFGILTIYVTLFIYTRFAQSFNFKIACSLVISFILGLNAFVHFQTDLYVMFVLIVIGFYILLDTFFIIKSYRPEQFCLAIINPYISLGQLILFIYEIISIPFQKDKTKVA